MSEQTNTEKKPLPPEVLAYFQERGRKQGNALKEKYGSEYFSRISKQRETFGPKPGGKNSALELAERYGVTRQWIYEVLKKNGDRFDESDFDSKDLWREAVVVDYYKRLDVLPVAERQD